MTPTAPSDRQPAYDAVHAVGDMTVYLRIDGSVRLEVTPGPLRVSRKVAEMAEEGEHYALVRDDDVLTFRGHSDDGTPQAYRYQIVGEEPGGPEGGWLLCQPLPDAARKEPA